MLFPEADELIFFRLGLGSDEREQRGPIWRLNQNKVAMLSKLVINDQGSLLPAESTPG